MKLPGVIINDKKIPHTEKRHEYLIFAVADVYTASLLINEFSWGELWWRCLARFDDNTSEQQDWNETCIFVIVSAFQLGVNMISMAANAFEGFDQTTQKRSLITRVSFWRDRVLFIVWFPNKKEVIGDKQRQ